MNQLYQNILHTDMLLAPLGILSPQEDAAYFCTPKNACIFGQAGVDGIHYCFIPGFEEMVFAVSPLNTPGNYVHPLAYNFSDFLRLLLACKSADALEQAWQWNQVEFDAYVNDIPYNEVQKNALTAIAEKTRLTPMDNPWQYVQTLQSHFDYSRLQFSDDYVTSEETPNADFDTPADVNDAIDRTDTPADIKEDITPHTAAGNNPGKPASSCPGTAGKKLPEWKVYFPDRRNRTHAGTELPIGKIFLWEGSECQIPSVYSCREGLAIDFLQKVPADQIQKYIEKWNLGPDSNYESFSSEELLLIENDNPLSVHPHTEAVLNGSILKYSQSTGCCWNPVFSMFDMSQAQAALAHYQLDPSFGWAVWRSYFPWKTRRKPQIKTLSVHLSTEKQAIPGPHFHADVPGDKTVFIHPFTGVTHTLTVTECTDQHLDTCHFHDPTKEYPGCYKIIGFTITPDLPKDAVSVTDCHECDHPRTLQTDDPDHTSAEAVSVIIGHSDGPSSIFFSNPGHPQIHYAASAPHFEPVQDTEWQILFHEQPKKDITVNLIDPCKTR